MSEVRRPTMNWLRQYGWLALAVALGALCRFWHLTSSSLFIDEGFTFHISSYAPRILLQEVARTDFHPPLFYLATHYLMRLLHWEPWSYRYITASFGVLTILVTWGVARLVFGTVAANVAAFVIALEPGILGWDRLYRMYAVLVALSTTSWWLLLKAERAAGRTARMYWSAYTLCAVVVPYLQYLGLLVIASQSLYAAVSWRRRWPAFIGFGAVVLALVPWAWAIKIQFPHGGEVMPLSSTRFSWPILVRATIGSGFPSSWMFWKPFDPLFCGFILSLLLAGLYAGRRTMLTYWLAPITVQIAFSLITGKNIVLPRHLYMYLPAFAVCVGVVIAALLATRWRLVGAVIGLLMFGISAISIPNDLFDKYYQLPDWYAVNTLLLQKANKLDLIVMVQGSEYWVVHDFSGFRGHQMDAPAIPSDIAPDIRWLRGYPRRRVWYIENQPGFTDKDKNLRADLEHTRHELGAWIQPNFFEENVVHILLFGPRTDVGRTKSVVNTTSP